jgi:hypothetical protein
LEAAALFDLPTFLPVETWKHEVVVTDQPNRFRGLRSRWLRTARVRRNDEIYKTMLERQRLRRAALRWMLRRNS